jgi:glycosyltransferase involved in cell wall biosynthesis
MTSKPLVSVVVPAYQAERFLAEALESVLKQDYSPLEVIVVDDGSTDRTAAIAASHPVRLLRRPHRGIAASRNAGLRASRGDLFAILDADDLWPTDRLRIQVEHLLEHPKLDLVLGLTEFFLVPGVQRPELGSLLSGGPVPGHPSTMLARRELLETVGGFDESIEISNDVDWLARAKDRGALADTLPQVLLHYRMHGANTTRDRIKLIESELLRVMRASVLRQREAPRG